MTRPNEHDGRFYFRCIISSKLVRTDGNMRAYSTTRVCVLAGYEGYQKQKCIVCVAQVTRCAVEISCSFHHQHGIGISGHSEAISQYKHLKSVIIFRNLLLYYHIFVVITAIRQYVQIREVRKRNGFVGLCPPLLTHFLLLTCFSYLGDSLVFAVIALCSCYSTFQFIFDTLPVLYFTINFNDATADRAKRTIRRRCGSTTVSFPRRWAFMRWRRLQMSGSLITKPEILDGNNLVELARRIPSSQMSNTSGSVFHKN